MAKPDKIPGMDPKAAEEQVHVQPVMPARLPPVRGKLEEYLAAHGWKKVGETSEGEGVWADPNTGGMPEQRVGAELPISKKKGADTETVLQWHCPPVAWDHPTKTAVALQRQREAAGETLAEKIVRKREELAQMEALAEAAAEE